jgi:predicted DNA-binding protein with PD1-like motif
VHSRQVNDRPNTFVLVFEPGEEAMSTLTAFAREQALNASQVTAIGGFERVVLGYFDRERRDYQPIPIEEQVEVLSLIGDIVTTSRRISMRWWAGATAAPTAVT